MLISFPLTHIPDPPLLVALLFTVGRRISSTHPQRQAKAATGWICFFTPTFSSPCPHSCSLADSFVYVPRRCHQQQDLGERGGDKEGDGIERREGQSICLGFPWLGLLLLSWQPVTLLHTAAFVLPPADPRRGVEEISVQVMLAPWSGGEAAAQQPSGGYFFYCI